MNRTFEGQMILGTGSHDHGNRSGTGSQDPQLVPNRFPRSTTGSAPTQVTGSPPYIGGTGTGTPGSDSQPLPWNVYGPCAKCHRIRHRYGEGGQPLCPTCRPTPSKRAPDPEPATPAEIKAARSWITKELKRAEPGLLPPAVGELVRRHLFRAAKAQDWTRAAHLVAFLRRWGYEAAP